MSDLAASYAKLLPPYELRSHQREAIAVIGAAGREGRRRAWVVLPPGSGKTTVGLETIRRRGDRAVVLCPNIAIQNQWLATWSRYEPAPEADTDRALAAPLTVLTYQSLATFDDDEPGDDGTLMGRLHPNGVALVEALRDAGPLTIVLDECHHLLEVWGRLLAEILELLPDAFVLGLTATPPGVLDRAQAALVNDLFGTIAYAASIPAAVREGHLAPFAELAWLTEPTAEESAWLAGQAERFTQLTTDLLDPAYGSVPFLTWLDQRFLHLPAPWHELETREPGLAAAGLRLAFAGLVDLPAGARLREHHRHPPTADDWVRVLDDWVRNCLSQSGSESDREVVEAIRTVLPSVGYQMTKQGIRRGRSPVDRLIARSAAKTQATVSIVAAEAATLGDRLRMLVLCDHEQAGATARGSLHEVLAEQAGSARLVLSDLVAHERTAALDPVLVTGRTVAAAPATARRIVDFVRRSDPERADGLRLEPLGEDEATVSITGGWSSRQWVVVVTRFLEAGHCRVLVGTRGLLGEGWDARGLNALVDLTTATTLSAVVQTRGRALRTDPHWREKVALTWSVVCVAGDHPRGDADWQRFVRKHDGYFGVDAFGEIASGVAHVDAAFSPYAPPPAADFDRLNAAMLVRAERRALIADRWRVGEPYEDRLVHTLRVRGSGAASPPVVAGGEPPRTPPPVLLGPRGPHTVTGPSATRRPWTTVRTLAAGTDLMAYACAVADGMARAGLSPVGPEQVRVVVEPDGEHRIHLAGVDERASAMFAECLDEVLAPIAAPRYVVPRYLLGSEPQWSEAMAGWRLLLHRLRPDGVVWHAVPSALGGNVTRAKAFAHGWNTWVSLGATVYTATPEGTGIVASHRGLDPLDVTTVMRTAWS